MTVATFSQPDCTLQDPVSHAADVDASIKVHNRIAGAFAPHEASTPALTVVVDAGMAYIPPTLSTVAQQTVSGFTVPSAGAERIDRVVIDALTGAATRVAGTEGSGSPTAGAPAIPDGKLPCCQVRINYTDTVITNDMITDERVGIPGSVIDQEVGTWTLTFGFSGGNENLSVGYEHRIGTYTKLGRIVGLFLNGVTNSFTYGSPTPVGNFQISGVPFPAMNLANHVYPLTGRLSGWTKAGYSQSTARISAAASVILVQVSGSGAVQTNLTAAEIPTTSIVNANFGGTYEADA